MNHAEVFSPTVSVALANAQPGRTYWWQVFAYNGEELRVADAGQWWAFSTANDTNIGPGNFGKTSPVSGTVAFNPLSLAWGASSGAVSATLVSATPGYSQVGQTLVWSGANVPAGGTTVLTITVRAASGPLPEGYTLFNTVVIGAVDGEIARAAPLVEVGPWRAYLPLVRRP